jgi:hypothetical protein
MSNLFQVNDWYYGPRPYIGDPIPYQPWSPPYRPYVPPAAAPTPPSGRWQCPDCRGWIANWLPVHDCAENASASPNTTVLPNISVSSGSGQLLTSPGPVAINGAA